MNDKNVEKIKTYNDEKKARGNTKKRRRHYINWDKLDNTANLFPVIAGEAMSNVYRISVTLDENVNGESLQEALNIVLPKFSGFKVRLRKGVFWFYLEENNKPAPIVKEEAKYPCRFIIANKNNHYLFRVNYFRNRINLEVFHVLTDGMGGINFLKELTFQYLRIVHDDLKSITNDDLYADTSLNREDGFIKNYRKASPKQYKTKRAFTIKGEKLHDGEFGVTHIYMNIDQLKSVAHKYNSSINEYIIGVAAFSIYREYLKGLQSKRPISIAVPVNLRPYFNSNTTKNFFAVVSAIFKPEKDEYTFEEVLEIIKKNLKSQITKEHLEKLFSYNVSNEQFVLARAVPLFLKNLAIKYVYTSAALANTTTFTNIGKIGVPEEYKKYIKQFYAYLAMSKGQNIKGTICSYEDTLVLSISSVIRDTYLQRAMISQFTKDEIEVKVETNGVYYE